MIFATGSHDVGSRRVWQSRRHPHAPRDVATSCITQPPLAAVAVERVAGAARPGSGRAFLADLYPKLVAYHSWCYDERDLDHTGLVTLIHPWECGLDSTPPWMDAFGGMRMPVWMRAAERLHLARLLRSCGTTPGCSRGGARDPTTTACACSRSRCTPSATASSCAACPRTTVPS